MPAKRPSTPKPRKILFPDFIKEDVSVVDDKETQAFTGISTSNISQFTTLSKGLEKEIRSFRVTTSKRVFKVPRVNHMNRKITMNMTKKRLIRQMKNTPELGENEEVIKRAIVNAWVHCSDHVF